VTATTLKLHRPGPLDIHPDADLLDAQGARWLHHHRLGNDHAHREFLARSGFGHCVALLYPHADTAILQTVTDLMYWSFALDDIRDAPGHDARAAAHMGRLQRTIEAPDTALLGDDPLSTALHDVITRMTCQIPPAQMRRFTEGMRTYFLGAAWELAARTTSEPLGLNETTGIRLYSVGAQPFVALIEAVNGYRLDHDELTAPAVQAMTEMTWLISAWDNDICSWSKESRGAAADNSFVTALARLHHQTTAQALAQAANLRNQVMARFLDLSDEITPTASASLRRYLGDLTIWLSGHLEFELSSPRYQHDDQALFITASPDRPTDATEPPIPAISWWWNTASPCAIAPSEHSV
jgi:hypothetical protein